MAANEVMQLIEAELPEGRQSLQDSHANLERVAQYCEGNYLQAKDKRHALEETKNYTTHSLASVAYQINSLATNFLKLLDLQQNQLAEMESSVNHLSQIVNIHKEKVARREIGVLTTNRSSTRPLGVKSGIVFPEQAERPIKYTRKPIDYTVLDDIGHGVRLHSSVPRPNRTPSISSQGSQAPTTKPPTPPITRSGSTASSNSGTLGRSQGGHYRSVAPPVAPPSVPANQHSHFGQVIHHPPQPGPRERYEMNYAPSVMGTVHSPPLVGMARPISQRPGPPASPSMVRPTQPPLAYQDSVAQLRYASHGWKDPPPPDVNRSVDVMTIPASPPLPPPPEHARPGPGPPKFEYGGSAPPPPHNFSDDYEEHPQNHQHKEEDPYAATGPQFTAQPAWVPKEYQEKVVAIFDYDADKGDELTFSENAVIYVIKKNDDGWWEGVMDGTTGLFPSNYVEPCI
ncbi:abl interactor 2-like isoform X1 [Haliotis rufescens]|uniref:abl interactor 2-like isoform X1 n=1 Tax=Haliotis rufescens TaxID=6454 RepID=UPI001EB06ED3|nr:abl interactor 2-like isoform X1 [Haliotis rufescens]